MRRGAVQHVNARALKGAERRPFPIQGNRPHLHIIRFVNAHKPRIAGIFHAVDKIAAE